MLNHFDLHEDGTVATVIFDKASLEATETKRHDTKNIINMLQASFTLTSAIADFWKKKGRL